MTQKGVQEGVKRRGGRGVLNDRGTSTARLFGAHAAHAAHAAQPGPGDVAEPLFNGVKYRRVLHK